MIKKNKIYPVLSPSQAVPSEYLGGVLDGAPGKLCWRSAPRRALNLLCGHSSPLQSGRGILTASNKKSGLSVIEIVIAVSVIVVFITGIAFAFTSFLKLSLSNTDTVKAAFLAEEAVEVVKFLRNSGWDDNIAPYPDTRDYFLNFSGSEWEIVEDGVLIDGLFDRRFRLGDVSRDSLGKIVESGGSLDSGTKKLTVFVSWKTANATTTKSVSTYISDI